MGTTVKARFTKGVIEPLEKLEIEEGKEITVTIVEIPAVEAVDALAQNPRPAGVRKLKGHERLYRIRVGDYRLIYEIDDSMKLIRVTKIRHRREAYQ